MRKLTLQNFIHVANTKHNYKFDYSIVKLINSTSKVDIICSKHGIFQQTPEVHLRGSECSKCSYEKRQVLNKSTTKEFIERSFKIHDDLYDYSLVVYKNNKKKVDIICPLHGVFNQIPSHHLQGSGCPKCGNKVKSKEFFLTESKTKHGDYYNYSNVDYIDTDTKVKIECPVHGEFEQRPRHHYNGAGCPMCRESKGERIIRKYLKENYIQFIPQKRFKDCRDKKPLPFDFYLPDFNICIEFDGEQHFKIKEQWGGEQGLLDRQRKDKIKTEYCENNNIKLIRIKNNEKTNIMK